MIARGQGAETGGGADPETGTKRSLKTDPYPNLVKYSPNVLKKKTKVLDINYKDKICFIKINVESRP